MVPSREIYWNIDGYLLMYLFFGVAMFFFAKGMYRHYLMWRTGKEELRFDRPAERLKLMLDQTFTHRRLLRDPFPGIMHLLIFWGFVVMTFGTFLVFLEADFGIVTLRGSFYLWFSLAMDIAGAMVLIGILMAWYRRYIVRPERLDNKPEDAYVLLLLFVIICTGFLLQGLRIASVGDPWVLWTPMGLLVANLLGGVGVGGWEGMHRFMWWFHMILAMGFIAYIPYSKLVHLVLIPANQYLSDLSPKGTIKPINLDDETQESFGVAKIEEFTWKQLLDPDACIRCGRCQDHCPAHLSGKSLNPKQMTQDFKEHWQAKAPLLLAQAAQKKAAQVMEGQKEVAAASEADQALLERLLIGDVIADDQIWACTTCRACHDQCPAYVEHIDKTIELRRSLVLMESRFPPEMQLLFRNMENNGNPWGLGWANRANWAEGLGVKTLAEDSELLYWPGCAGAFDDRNKKVATAVVKLLQQAGINFAILGNEEKCCGDSARRLGNEYLFQVLAQENIATMNSYGVKTIVTQCPHCFNSLSRDYPQFGGNYQVMHHSQFLLDLIKQGKLKPGLIKDKKVVYHDSCYLGRYHGVYQAPRQILQAVPGLKPGEMERRLDQSFCCGAGGGRMWLEETVGQKIYLMRTEQALAGKPDLIGTACPFCLTMMEDGVKFKEVEEQVKVVDLAEILWESVAVEPASSRLMGLAGGEWREWIKVKKCW